MITQLRREAIGVCRSGIEIDLVERFRVLLFHLYTQWATQNWLFRAWKEDTVSEHRSTDARGMLIHSWNRYAGWFPSSYIQFIGTVYTHNLVFTVWKVRTVLVLRSNGVSDMPIRSWNRISRKIPSSCNPIIETVYHSKLAFQKLKWRNIGWEAIGACRIGFEIVLVERFRALVFHL